MTDPSDPWRTLGLSPGATADEIRRAYRRLAKANHPDAAGEGALPRFLAIQAAYEHLAGARVRRRPGARPGSRTGRNPDGDENGPQEPWRGGPPRAGAARRGGRPRAGAAAGGGRGRPPPGGRPPPPPTGAGA